jgi:NADH dehydrogenase FAD-containing subunit
LAPASPASLSQSGLPRRRWTSSQSIGRTITHLFQPLLYQVAKAGLSPADITSPIRSLVRDQRNTRVLWSEVTGVDHANKHVDLGGRNIAYNVLTLATEATHGYFGTSGRKNDSGSPHPAQAAVA